MCSNLIEPHYPILPLQKMTFLSRSRLPLGRLRSTRLSLVPFTRRCLVAHTSPVEGDGNGNNTPKPPPLNPPPPPRWSKWKQHPQTPPPDGGNGNNTSWWNYIHFGSALVVALGLGWTFFRDGIYPNVQKVMKAIDESKLRMPQIDGYIKRNQEMKAFKKMLYNPGLKTIVVTGPRGSGKSTLVQHCLADKGGVVRIILNTQSMSFSEEKFAENVMKTIGFPYTQSGTNVMALLSLALQGLCESQEELPIFVIEADNNFSPRQLKSLLILMKQYGADEKLIRPIVVLSSSTSTFGRNISQKERYFHVDDLTDEQCLEYLESRLSSMIEGDEQEISNFVKKVVPHLGIGNRLMHLDSVLVGMSGLKQHKLDKVQEHIESYVEEEVRTYTDSVRSFFRRVKKTHPRKENVNIAFKLLLEKGSMPLRTFRELCGVYEEEHFIHMISCIDPPPFYVNTEHSTIHFHAAIFEKDINFDILFDSV